MGTFSWTHLLIIALLFVLLFGAKRLPDAARGLGRSLRIFKSEVGQMQSESATPANPAATPAPPQQLPASAPQTQAPIADPQQSHKSL
ncbi:Sec-independent protein translocase subunit TatA [Nocardia rhizosphaerihabitans]|uniref:Sec-independent protein translocase protein TatA n=1 Tax=Nocardia rhizosphaerihabitans TaxID=1691570 RepID=A0ABQ2K5Y5_9NOCA|nr:Sec-independent protein translocase subunit TatA [Nocardia rhizosphaerihabitans]GGN67092.1 Sec-independent protein translocase protein TatA [Nocardia rhizosphaerihabitans]